MGFLLIIPVAGASLWIAFSTVRRIRRERTDRSRWLTPLVLTAFGFGVGLWLALRFQYQPTPKFRFSGFPVPVAISQLHGEKWTESVLPPSVRWGGVIANVMFGVGAAFLPLKVLGVVEDFRKAGDLSPNRT